VSSIRTPPRPLSRASVASRGGSLREPAFQTFDRADCIVLLAGNTLDLKVSDQLAFDPFLRHGADAMDVAISRRPARPLSRGSAAGSSLRELRDKALLAVAYTTLCRRAELVGLQRADLEIGAEGSASVRIRRGKTDQEGAGAIAPITPDALRHLQAWLEAAGIGDGPLFRAGGERRPGGPARSFFAKRIALRDSD
jgi:integrase